MKAVQKKNLSQNSYSENKVSFGEREIIFKNLSKITSKHILKVIIKNKPSKHQHLPTATTLWHPMTIQYLTVYSKEIKHSKETFLIIYCKTHR